MSGPLRFRALHVRRMPGFEDVGFRLHDLAAGINLIHGPNASGKTTAARALQRLIWPASGDERASLEGRLTLKGQPWRVEVEGTRAVWERDGEPAEAPALPSASSCSRYLLSLTDLLEADDRDLADIIRVESAGGYDVPGAGDSLDFGAGGRPVGLMRALREARRKLDEANDEATRLRGDRARLSELEAERVRLERQAGSARALEHAIALAETRAALEAATRELDAFPSAMASLRGNEVEQLVEWADREKSLRSDLVAAVEREAGAGREIEAAALGDGLPSSVLNTLDNRLMTVRSADSRIAADARALEDARARRAQAGRTLGIDGDGIHGDGIDGDGDGVPDFHASDTARLDAFMERAQSVRSARAAIEARLRVLADPDEADSSIAPGDETLSDGIRILRAWLRTAPGGADKRWAGLVTVSIVAFLVLAAVLAGAGTIWAPAFALAALPAVAAVVLLLLRPSGAADPRAGLEAEARRLGHAPDAWTDEAVRNRLDDLETRRGAREQDAQRRGERIRVEQDRTALAESEAALESERVALAASLGMDLDLDDLTLTLTAARLRQWEEARAAEVAAAARLEAARNDRRRAFDEAAAQLAPFGYAPDDADALAGDIDELRDRREADERARAALESARRDRERAESGMAAVREKRAALLTRVGVADERAVRNLADRLADYRAACQARDTARRDLAAEEAALRTAVERAVDAVGVAELTALSPDRLARRLEDALSAAKEERELFREIEGIRANLERARTRHDVEDALAEVTAARAALAAQRDEDMDDAIGAALVEWLEASASESNRPPVFRRARELLSRITRGHYRLDLARDGSAFRAYDTVARRGRSLDELSAGTRVQLLLAVRVAFVETLEQGAAPPLLLDEVLANCDDVRATAIIDAAIALARAGRQVFYFTAQADELAKWRDALRRHDVDWAERELTDAAPRARTFDWAGRSPPRDAVPAPEGYDHMAYGALLRVPPFDPWRDTAAIHLWYLVTDVAALHALLCLGIDRWGRLQELARHGGDDLPVGQAILDDARRTADLCARFASLWRRGRGRPLDRAALEDSGAITDTFLDRVADLCRQLDGDAGALLDALDRRVIPRFRESSVEELREFCRARGHVSDDPPMSHDRIHVALVATATSDTTRDEADPTSAARQVAGLIERLCHGPRDAVAAGEGESS